ncbi:putative CoA-substrate-specific enzyme activase [Desulfitispora alkaliphila]|uniref:acyl-CoA dehydratase activase n=1 Tax=Desulfitispora alkaliphila TaxID=622674 RepID=UPI003D195D78
MYTVGIDVGSVSTKGVIFDGSNWKWVVKPTGWSPKEVGAQVLDELCQLKGVMPDQLNKIVGTGYGRIHMPFSDKTVSEIACHSKGANYLFPKATGVIDVGGQDSKAMYLDQEGRVEDFVLNDKCAAGTGRFLQVTLQALGVDISEVDSFAQGARPLEIGSMCAVFAETEVLNLMVQGNDKPEIVAGILKSIAKKIVSMAGRVNLSGQVVFTGGLAKSQVLRDMLQELSGWEIVAVDNPQVTGALGAAVIANEMEGK